MLTFLNSNLHQAVAALAYFGNASVVETLRAMSRSAHETRDAWELAQYVQIAPQLEAASENPSYWLQGPPKPAMTAEEHERRSAEAHRLWESRFADDASALE